MNSIVLSVKYSDAASHFSKHYHDCHEMFYVTGGRAKITVENKEYSVCKGNLIIISCYEKHSVSIESGDYKRYTLRIAPDFYADVGEDYVLYSLLTNRPESFTHVVDVSENTAEFDGIFSRLAREYENAGDYSRDMLDMLFKQILINLYRKEPEMFSHPDNQLIEVIGDLQVRFRKSCGERYTLTQLSREYNVSVYYLSHLFKKVTGYSVMNYLLSCRIANAKRLLAKTNKDIGSIARECGFSDSANFSRKFRELTGFTPSDFRRK